MQEEKPRAEGNLVMGVSRKAQEEREEIMTDSCNFSPPRKQRLPANKWWVLRGGEKQMVGKEERGKTRNGEKASKN